MRCRSSVLGLGAGVLLLGGPGASLGLPSVTAEVAAADVVLVREGDVVREDLYVLAQRALIQGTVEGDVFVLAGDLRVTGTVEGDVVGAASDAVLGGEIGGSARLLVGELLVDGRVGDDLVVGAMRTDVDGPVGRDVLALVGELSITRRVGRDVRGQALMAELQGVVGRNVELAARRLVVGSGARIGGDLVYSSPSEARVSAAAEVEGNLVRRPSSPPNIEVRAAQRLSRLLLLLAFLATGLVLLALLPNVTARARDAAAARPWHSVLLGLGVLLLTPLAVGVLFLTVIGFPIALLLLGMWMFGLFVGAVPALAALGGRLLGSRASIYATFLLGAAIWAGLQLVPFLGPLVFVAGLVWGLGGWLVGGWSARGSQRLPDETPQEPVLPVEEDRSE